MTVVLDAPLTPAAPTSVSWGVSCPWCSAPVGAQCVKTTTGEPTGLHAARWDASNYAWRNREMWFVLRENDDRFGLSAGDVLPA